jgi:TonB-dependent receptor
VLPSFNLQFLPTPNVHIRFAASKGITLPSFNNASAAGNIGIHESNLPQGMNLDPNSPQTYTTANIGNPNLKPQISDNYDISLEWYLPHNGLMHVGLFDKRIHNYISYGIFAEPLGLLMPDGTTKTYNTLVTNEFNGQTATVKGVEAGFTKFFDFLPGLLSGFGVDTNFAYINSKAPGDLSYDMLGNRIHGLPVDLLSKYNFNVTAMYEKGPISLRLAYSWRSKYLLTPGANGTNGTYTDATLCAGNPETHTAAGTCSYALPVFGANYGQLDFGATFKFSEHVSLSIDAQNLTNAVTRTLMGYGAQQYGRSWFIGDRRYSAQLRFGF